MKAAGSALLFLLSLFLQSWNANFRDLRKYTLKGYAQGTDYTIAYYAEGAVVDQRQVDSLLAVIDSSMSLYKPYSLINKINAGPKGSYAIDAHFRRVLGKSFEIVKDSQGIFDVTVAPLVQLWGFGTAPVDRFPDSAAVRQALRCVGMEKIRLKGNYLEKLDACVQLDFNGIAQGYTVDVLANMLEDCGIRHYVVELGGELRVRGPKPDGSPMRIGMERPATEWGDSPLVQDVMSITEGAITTAGNYRRYLQDGDHRVSHHIDPKTGYPFDTEIISATLYANDALTADGYDNVFMAMKAAEAVTFANARKDMEVFVVYRDRSGVVRDTMSTGFRDLLISK
ncbi:FAD:protein FMN transferase [Olivibacter sitiensis]|uniref:FAD:protein FMN transferase n=1 Tax=Olivibacter sitiensis TaxID=376470 RepID=UPI0004200257|nr:FAD:protein FMN transferase [Olivibacter sitiensis]